jgi:hypothetical protein
MTLCLIAAVLALALSSSLAVIVFALGRRLRKVEMLRRMLAWRVCDLEVKAGVTEAGDGEEVRH